MDFRSSHLQSFASLSSHRQVVWTKQTFSPDYLSIQIDWPDGKNILGPANHTYLIFFSQKPPVIFFKIIGAFGVLDNFVFNLKLSKVLEISPSTARTLVLGNQRRLGQRSKRPSLRRAPLVPRTICARIFPLFLKHKFLIIFSGLFFPFSHKKRSDFFIFSFPNV